MLEQADLARERGLGQVQAGGGPGEALLLGHGQGVGQLVQLHDSELIALIFMLIYVFDVPRADPMVWTVESGDRGRLAGRGSGLG